MLMQIQDFLDARKYPGVYFIATNRNYFEIMPEARPRGRRWENFVPIWASR
jgi:hypothetical protein